MITKQNDFIRKLIRKELKSINENYYEDKIRIVFDEMKSNKIGDVISNEKLYNYVNALHDFDMDNDFIKEHILKYSKFKLVNLPANDIDLIGSVDPTLVNDYGDKIKTTNWYPPIIYDLEEDMIIDGYHRAEAVKKSGKTHIMAWVGI